MMPSRIRGAALLCGLLMGCAARSPAGRPPAGVPEAPPPPPAPALAAPPSRPEPARPGAPAGPTTIDLVAVMRLARERNLDVALLDEQVREARAREASIRGRLWPTLGVGLRATGHDGLTQATDGSFLDVSKRSASVGGTVAGTWQIGEAVFASLAARQRTTASRFRAKAGTEATVLAAGEGYVELVRAGALLRAEEEALALGTSLREQMEARVVAGGGLEAEVLRTRAQEEDNRRRVAAARGTRTAVALRLAELLDLPADVELRAVDGAPLRLSLVAASDSDASLVQEALAHRPEVAVADGDIRAADEERRAACYAPLVPTLTAEVGTSGLGRTYGDLEGSSDYRVGVEWVIGPGGLFDGARAREAESRQRQASIVQDRVRARITREVREARAGFEEGTIAAAAAERSIERSQESLQLFQQRFAAGLGQPIDVILAGEALSVARVRWIDALAAVDRAQLRLWHATGRGFSSMATRAGAVGAR